MTTYVLKGGEEGAKRLKILAEASWPATQRLLRQRIGLQPGWRCLYAGCGNGHVAIQLAGIVGSESEVVGEDFDAQVLEVARQDARQARVNVTFRQRALSDLPDGEGYDLVYARFLLSHVPDPAEGLASLMRAARPGGVVVVEDVDFRMVNSWPESEAVERYAELYRETAKQMGANPLIGPELVGLFVDAGLSGVDFDVIEPMSRLGQLKLMPQVTLEHIRGNVVRHGLATDAEIDAVIRDLDDLREDPRSLMGHPRIFQVWGLRPG